MKTRESGMPGEVAWAGFFAPVLTLQRLGMTPEASDVVDLGCGYGTFTIPAAQITRGTVHALDIDADMLETTARKAKRAGLENIHLEQRDFMADGTGLPNASIDYVMLFNILHCEQPEVLLHEAYRILSPGGRVGIMHWNYDPNTPRGPSMDIRTAEQRATQVREQIIALSRELVDAREVGEACALFDPVWETLSAREQARILRLLIDRVDYDGPNGKVAIIRPSAASSLAMFTLMLFELLSCITRDYRAGT